MRLISAVIILVLISSCAHNRIRYVQSGPRQIVEVNEEKSKREVAKETESMYSQTAPFSTNSQDVTESQEVETPSQIQPQDSTENIEESKVSQEVYDEAMMAEFEALRASRLMITAVTLFPTGFIPFLPFLGFLISLVFFIAGFIFLRRARASRYSTAEGVKLERRARLFQTVYLIIAGLTLLFITAIILLYIFW